MSEINLLPQELKPKGYAIKLSKTFRKVATVCLIVFFVGFVLFIGANVLLSFQVRSLKNTDSVLKSEIAALEQTEQKLILVEDRLQKIINIQESNDSTEEVESIQAILDRSPLDVLIEEITLNNNSANLVISTDRSSNLTRFLSVVFTLGFRRIDLKSFDYNESSGYKVEVAIAK